MKQKIFKDYPNPVFIETGCYAGDGIKCALEAGFERIISIEISPNWFAHCLDRFKSIDGVELYLGDSYTVLPVILKTVNDNCTFWLDAHPSAKEKTGVIKVPVLHEINSIIEHMDNNNLMHTILVDDMRCFDKTQGWWGVTKEEIINTLSNAGFSISYADGHIPNDILIATL